MSYPYSLDLAFNSEKATADSIGRISFGSGSGLPTTQEELQEMLTDGRACSVDVQGGVVDLTGLSQAQSDSLPENLAGVVADGEGEIIPLEYTISTDPSLEIHITTDPLLWKSYYIILKQAVDSNEEP